ncbi:MAG: hypothetical protein ACHP7N_04595 [Caulobacterales bacterium]
MNAPPIVSENAFAAAEVFQRPDGLFQFRGFFSTKEGWEEINTSGIYADAAAAEADARIWVDEESTTP